MAGTERDSSANEAQSSDQKLATLETWVRGVSRNYDAHQRDLADISTAIHTATLPNGHQDIVHGYAALSGPFLDEFAASLKLEREQAKALIELLLDAIQTSTFKVKWNLGRGRVRTDAALPEVALTLIRSSVEMLQSAFSNHTIMHFRNRQDRLIEALSAFADEANGGVRNHMTFYQRLGERVARDVLDHKLSGPEPRLTPSGVDYEEIEQAALTQLVYFVQAGDDGPVKIGIARDPENRLASLQTGHYQKLWLRVTTAGGQEQERAYHRRFAEHRLHGEWFSPHPDILAEIERLNSAQ